MVYCLPLPSIHWPLLKHYINEILWYLFSFYFLLSVNISLESPPHCHTQLYFINSPYCVDSFCINKPQYIHSSVGELERHEKRKTKIKEWDVQREKQRKEGNEERGMKRVERVSELQKKREREWLKMKRVEIEIWRGRKDSKKERNKTKIKDKEFLWPISTMILTKLFNLFISLKLR